MRLVLRLLCTLFIGYVVACGLMVATTPAPHVVAVDCHGKTLSECLR